MSPIGWVRAGVLKSKTAIPDSGGTHQWNTDEGSGTTLTDSVGNLNGTISGPDWITGGKGAGSAYLDYNPSNGDYVDIGGETDPTLKGIINDGVGTVGFWIKPQSDGSSIPRSIFVNENNNGTNSIIFTINSSEINSFITNSDDNYFVLLKAGFNDFSNDVLNNWVFVAFSLDGSSCTIYTALPSESYNVKSIGSQTFSTSNPSYDLDQPMSIGRETNSDRWFFDGGIDIGFVDDKGQSESELQSFVDDTKSFYQSKTAIPDSGIVYDFDAASVSASDGDSVSTWTDQEASIEVSGSATYRSSTSSLGNNPTLEFNGSSDRFTQSDTSINTDVSTPLSIHTVINPTNNSGAPRIVHSTAGNYSYLQLIFSLDTYDLVDDNNTRNRVGTPDTNPQVFTGYLTGSKGEIRIDDSKVGDNTSQNGAYDGDIVIGMRAGNSENFEGNIARIIWNDASVVNPSELDQFLIDKYGI